MDDDDENVFLSSWLDKYQNRPRIIENICLAEFVANYTYHKKKEDPEQNDTQPDDTEDFDIPNTDNSNLPKYITLYNKLELKKRTQPAIIRSHQFSQVKEPQNFYHARLLLYYPWRNEDTDLKNENGKYIQKYFDVKDILGPNLNKFEPHREEVQTAWTELEENDNVQDAWASLAPQNEQLNSNATRHTKTLDAEHAPLHPLADKHGTQQTATDLGLVPHSYEHHTHTVSNAEWFKMISSLNPEQQKLHQFIVQWCKEISLSYRTAHKPDPFQIFLTGGAGVGKSHLVRTIVQTAQKLLHINTQSPEELNVMVCASTGAAAFNIKGRTLHSAFNIFNLEQAYMPMSHERLAQMRLKLQNLNILIIDEISMVGANLLLYVHRRLCDIMASEEPFANVSILAVGDLMQLPPVFQKAIFKETNHPLAQKYGSLWKKHFRVIELTEIMRQKGDTTFAQLLNRVRTGDQTEDDITLLKQRVTNDNNLQYPTDTQHAFTKNTDVDQHNNNMLQTLPGPIITIQAQINSKDDQTGRISTNIYNKKTQLPQTLSIAVGAKVTLTTNVATSDGLVNSAQGIVTGFIPAIPSDPTLLQVFKPKFILIHFSNSQIGQSARTNFTGILQDPNSVPIGIYELRLAHNSKRAHITTTVKQFPIQLAWAVTIHKEQGKTEDQIVVSCKGGFFPGQFYTAISRPTTLNGLFLIGQFRTNIIKPNQAALKEMKRLHKNMPFNPSLPTTIKIDSQQNLKLSLLNVNSLNAHNTCVQNDPWLKSSYVICLIETWLKPSQATHDFTLKTNNHKNNPLHNPEYTHTPLRQDRSATTFTNHKGGILLHIHKDLHIVTDFTVPNIHLEHKIAILSHRANPTNKFCVVALYNVPETPTNSFLELLEILITSVPHTAIPTILCGDFNINFLQPLNVPTQKLVKLLKYYSFTQIVTKPTHNKGALLDHVYINRNASLIQHSNIPVYYSDHFHVQCSIPYNLLQ